MLVMPTGTAMHGKWEGASMTPPQLPYKIERPAYSTPPPVENTPANNECRMVDLRGSKVASFHLGREEYICLPQAFELFLKHLVGGLHTVYTKLKRLSIHPVVCNVEQVRILRGLGAIQPGVNRCKLITRKDFEVLYQDCTTASRPGRPPKRYPMLPPTADPMSHHANMRNSNVIANSLINQNEYSAYHKRMRMDHGMDNSLDRRASTSPSKDEDKSHPGMSVLPNDVHSNATANLAYFQALRHQYQQAAASGLHNGLDSQQINPALAPFMMMSHPTLFASGIPPTSMAMLNHINQLAQSHAAGGAMSSVAAAAAAQLVASGSSFHSNANNSQNPAGHLLSARENDKDSDAEDGHVTERCYNNNNTDMSNGMGSDGQASPSSSVGSGPDQNRGGELSDGIAGAAFGVRGSPKTTPMGQKQNNDNPATAAAAAAAAVALMRPMAKGAPELCNDEEAQSDSNAVAGMSSMHNLLTNIQGLLKVAADNANLQEKHSSFEIADLKLKLTQERQLRENAERKAEESERGKVEAEGDLQQERKENKRLHAKIISMQRMLGHDVNAGEGEVIDRQSPRSAGSIASPRLSHDNARESTPPPTSGSSPIVIYPQAAPTFDSVFSARIAAVHAINNQRASPPSSPNELNASSNASNVNNSNNYASDEQSSPDYGRRPIMPDGRTPDLAIDLGIPRQERSEHLGLQDARLYFKNSLLFQPSASQ